MYTKISDLIRRLQKVQKREGDLRVFVKALTQEGYELCNSIELEVGRSEQEPKSFLIIS